jgi:hypothetical protein
MVFVGLEEDAAAGAAGNADVREGDGTAQPAPSADVAPIESQRSTGRRFIALSLDIMVAPSPRRGGRSPKS